MFALKQANCFGNNISSEISIRIWKPLTLPYKNQIQGGTKADSISAHRRRHDTNLNSEQVPYEAWHLLHHPWGRSICYILCSLAGDCCTSTSTQAERVFSWMGFLLNKRRLSLSGGESVTMQLFLNDNLELWVDVCLIPRWDDNKLWYPKELLQNWTVFLVIYLY